MCPGFPTWAPRRGHGQALDHVLCVVSSDSTTYPLTACHCYDGMPTSFRWAR
nr:MAG TPA: hypothetical protein [Caudoviricetes sp.]